MSSLEKLFNVPEKPPTDRQIQENKILIELGEKALSFAQEYERGILLRSRSPSYMMMIMYDISEYPTGMSLEDKIWYRSCLQTYSVFYRKLFFTEIYSSEKPEQIVFDPNFESTMGKFLRQTEMKFSEPEIAYFLEKAVIIKNEAVKYGLGGSITGELIRNALDNLVGRIGYQRYIDWYKNRFKEIPE